MGKWPVEVGRKHPVTMRTASLKTLGSVSAEASVSAETPDWFAVLRDKVAMRSILAPATHPEPTSRSAVSREDSCFAQCH